MRNRISQLVEEQEKVFRMVRPEGGGQRAFESAPRLLGPLDWTSGKVSLHEAISE